MTVAVNPTARPLLTEILAAATDDLTGPGGATLETAVILDGDEAEVTYRLRHTRLCTRRLRVDESARIVALLDLDLPKWWYDGTEIHEQFVANLAGRLQHPCLVTAVLRPPSSHVWAAHFGWARRLENANAAALRAGVGAITPAQADGEELPWGGADLPERVQLLAGPDPDDADGRGSWRHLVRSLGPADLVAALDGLHNGLANAVFTHVPAWFGDVSVDPDPS